jgi:hypothetical protein
MRVRYCCRREYVMLEIHPLSTHPTSDLNGDFNGISYSTDTTQSCALLCRQLMLVIPTIYTGSDSIGSYRICVLRPINVQMLAAILGNQTPKVIQSSLSNIRPIWNPRRIHQFSLHPVQFQPIIPFLSSLTLPKFICIPISISLCA